MEDRTKMTDVAVVGGGLGGLAAATYAARGGSSVVLCEKASALGGRAVTTQVGEFRFNLGPHALYAGQHGIAVLRELGVPFSGAKPSPSGAFAVANGPKDALPGGFLSLLATSLLSLPAKLETARLLGSFGRLDPRPLARVPIGEWIDAHVRHPEVRQLVAALVRVATYSHDPERLSAGSALAQVQSALSASVLYLDGGWQTLVDGVRAAAQAAGVRIVPAARATTVERADSTWRLRLADGAAIGAQAAVVAGGPETAAALFTGPLQAGAQRRGPGRDSGRGPPPRPGVGA